MTDCVHLSCLYIWYDRHLIHVCHDRHTIVHMTWLYIWFCCWLTLLLFIDVMHTVSYLLYFYSLIIICSHVICTCTFPFILTHSLGVLTFWICTSRFLHVILLIRYLERITGILRSQSSLTRLSFFGISVSSLFLSLSWLCALDSVLVLSFYSYPIIVLDIYMSYCSDIDLS